MQVHEHAGQVQQATRLPDMGRALDDTSATPDKKAERMSPEESRRPATRPPAPLQRRYGAGF